MPSSNKLRSCGRRRACWLECHAELIHRDPIPDLQTYDHNRAYELISKIKSVKPIVRCKLQCLNDAIKMKKTSTFATQPPRRLYLFRDIQRFYAFTDYPNILIFGCNDPDHKTRSYEYFKLDTSNVRELCDLINRAHSHRLCILVHDENSLVRYHSSQSSLAAESERISNQVDLHEHTESKTEIAASPSTSNGDLVNNDEDLMETTDHVEEVAYTPNHHEVEVMEEVKCEAVSFAPNYLPRTSPIPEHLRSDPLFERLCKNVNEEELYAVDMKYIDSHPERGNEITNRGPTYLFVAHHKYPDSSRINRVGNGKFDGQWFENTAEVGFTTTYVD